MTKKSVESKFRTPYVKFDRVDGVVFPDNGKTHQSFRDSCDVNNIVRKYSTTGVFPEATGNPHYGDFMDMPSYRDSLDLVIRAEDQFMSLPAKVRARFMNDPGQLLEFVSNPENLEEMYVLGLAERPVPDVSPLEGVTTVAAEGDAKVVDQA